MIDVLVERASGYEGLFLACATAGVFQPFPQDVALAWAGVQLRSGEMAWVPALLVAVAGVLTRDVAIYWLGRLVGDWLLARTLVRRFLPEAKVERARGLIRRRGPVAVMMGRFAVGMRAPIFLVAGVVDFPFASFLAWDLLGAALTVPLGVGAGWVFGPPVLDAVAWGIRRARLVVPLLLVAAVIAWGLWLRRRRTMRQAVSREE